MQIHNPLDFPLQFLFSTNSLTRSLLPSAPSISSSTSFRLLLSGIISCDSLSVFFAAHQAVSVFTAARDENIIKGSQVLNRNLY